MKDKTTYRLNPEQLARLMALGLEGADAQKKLAAGRESAEALQEMLTDKLLLDAANADSIPAVLNRSCDEFLPVADRTIGDLLLNPDTDLAITRSLKDYAKELVRRADSEATQAAATVVYYSAIASALAFHHGKISQHTYLKLDKSFTELERRLWIPPELKDLFEKAQVICRQRKRTAG